jgi:hypothetical protein
MAKNKYLLRSIHPSFALYLSRRTVQSAGPGTT